MLIENNNLENQIVCFKLVSGEEVVAKCVKETSLDITITKPVVIQMQMVGPNQAGIGFVPFTVASEEDARLVITKAAISMMPSKARRDIASQYSKMTSNIELPTTPSIIR